MRKQTTTAAMAALALGLASAAIAQSLSPAMPGAPANGGGSSFGFATNSSSAATINSASQVRATLESNGYSDVQSIQRSRTGFTATAMKDGKLIHLAIGGRGAIGTR